MSWTRLDDGFTESQPIRPLSLSARWHLLALIQYCSRHRQYDGFVRTVDAIRASDVDDPRAAMAELVSAGPIAVTENGYRVVAIEDHIPPPHLRDDHARPKSARSSAEWRRRTCEAGEHSKDCPRETCPEKQGTRDRSRAGSREDSRAGSRQDRTGQDRPGQEAQVTELNDSPAVPWPEPVLMVPPSVDQPACAACGRASSMTLIGGRCRRCAWSGPVPETRSA